MQGNYFNVIVVVSSAVLAAAVATSAAAAAAAAALCALRKSLHAHHEAALSQDRNLESYLVDLVCSTEKAAAKTKRSPNVQ